MLLMEDFSHLTQQFAEKNKIPKSGKSAELCCILPQVETTGPQYQHYSSRRWCPSSFTNAPSQQLTGTSPAATRTRPESEMGTQHEQEWDMASKFLEVQTFDHSKADEHVYTLLQTMSNT